MHASLSIRKGIENNFHNYGGPAKLMHACLFVRFNIERVFNHCRGSVKLLQASLCVRKDVETSFHHCGGPAKLMQASFWCYTSVSAMKSIETNNLLNSGGLVKPMHACLCVKRNIKSSFQHFSGSLFTPV